MNARKYLDGAHSTATFARTFLEPLFEADIVTEHPDATEYRIAYGEFCAYSGQRLLATWSEGVPDCEADDPGVLPVEYRGRWVNVAI